MSVALKIALAEAKYIGPIHARYLLEELGNVEAIFSSEAELKRRLPRLSRRILSSLFSSELHHRAQEIARWSEQRGLRCLFVEDEGYPQLLRECPDAPVMLYASGDYDFNASELHLSVVGTRNITPHGQSALDRLLEEIYSLTPRMPIYSGLAYGVDVAAHRKALALSMPTVAVLAHGLDRIYPSVHAQTAQEIVQRGGALLCEYPPGTRPDRFNFVARNRIIAGLSQASLIIEAGSKSGSLITAELAASYDREVLAVPGRIQDTYSRGCNELIASMKGVLVQSGQDILSRMGWKQEGNALLQELAFAPPQTIDHPLLRLIAELQPAHINDLIRRSGMDMRRISAELFELELEGHIRSLPGSLYALV